MQDVAGSFEELICMFSDYTFFKPNMRSKSFQKIVENVESDTSYQGRRQKNFYGG